MINMRDLDELYNEFKNKYGDSFKLSRDEFVSKYESDVEYKAKADKLAARIPVKKKRTNFGIEIGGYYLGFIKYGKNWFFGLSKGLR